MSWLDYPITHGYLPNYDPNQWDTPHFADDVGTPFHTPITALLPGTVVQEDAAVWDGQPGGIEVFVKPDNNSYPEYYFYHLDTTSVFKGEHLQAGQQVGLSGGQNQGGSNPVSATWSSGPHTHVGFFSNYINTPVGSRPYGPDISSLLSQLKSTPGTNNPGPLASVTNGGTIPLNNTGVSLPGISVPWQWSQIPDFLWRLAFGAFGILLVYLALKHFLGSEEINVTTEEGKK